MNLAKLLLAALVAAGITTQDLVKTPKQTPTSVPAQQDKFSPNGYYDLLTFEQTFPGIPGSQEFRKASTQRYWIFQGLAYRGFKAEGAAWTSAGPETSIQTDSGRTHNISGRVSALAISPNCEQIGPCRLWVGTAGGGVWRTDNAMTTTDDAQWRWIGRGLGTNNIGSLTLDPTDKTGNTIYVGTGETNTPANSGAGTGLFRSTDGGDHWTRVSTMVTDPVVAPTAIDFTATRGISCIAIDPTNAQTLYVATATAMYGMTAVRGGQVQKTGYTQPRTGLYKSNNGGASWALVYIPNPPTLPANPNLGVGVGDTMEGVKFVKFDPRNTSILYVTAWNNPIVRSAPSLEFGDASFKPVYQIVGRKLFRDLAMFELVVKNGHTRMYVYNGTEDTASQGFYRVDNADVSASGLATASSNTTAWISLTTSNTTLPGSVSRQLCSAQCFYDLLTASPPGEPDTIIIGGVQAPSFGEATIRSTNAGVSWLAFGNDGQNPRQLSHVDVRAIVFHPRNPSIAFVGSDGGVVRNDGTFVNIADRCGTLFPSNVQCLTVLQSVPNRIYFLNKGLQTLQFYNVAVDPQDPLKRLIGGLQDNNTIWRDGTGDPRVWKTLFGSGDGTSASGFHPTKSNVLFASFQSNRFFTNFRNGDTTKWVRTDDPIRVAAERDTVVASTGRQFLTFDQVNPDTQFTGFQHIWRTPDNGGDQAFLESRCGFPSGGTSSLICGDWVPLGVAFPFAAGSDPSSASRQPGDLTSATYGGDRIGGLIVAAERSPADAGTLWAATSFGRLFVSKNANGPAPDVQFVRVDTPLTPNRFITRIVADHDNPNVAIISFSGFNALTPATPGHIFRVEYDANNHTATYTVLDADLGDLPINTIAVDHLRGDLYAGTDFGPLVLRQGSPAWEVAGIGFPEALIVGMVAVPEKRLLVAATHGMGIFYMKLPD